LLSGGGKAIAGNILWLAGERVVRLLLGFVVGAWVGRYLGPERYGTLAYAVAFVAIFQAVATLGSDTIVVRDLVRRPEHAHRLLGTLLRLRILAGILCWIAAVAAAWLLDPHGDTALLVAIVGCGLVFQAADTVDLWFQSELQSRRTVVAKLMAYLVSNGIRIALVLGHAPLIAFAAVAAVDSAFVAIGLGLAYRRYPLAMRWSHARTLSKAILVESWPFLLSSLSVLIYLRIDQIMLRTMRGDHELGLFAAAMPLSSVWQIIPTTLVSSLAPLVARRKAESEAAYQRTLLTIYRLFGVVSLMLATATALLAPSIVRLLYGPAFEGTAHVLAIHAFSNVFVALGLAQSLWITNEGAGRVSMMKTLTGGVIAVVGNLLLIPSYGAVGAAWVTIISFATSAILSNLVLAPEVVLNQLGINARLPWDALIKTRRLGGGISDPAA
jgi:PST family polysaccharide transporter